MSDWKNRIVGSGEENPEQLLANPKNWRVHPQFQQDSLEAVLDSVGFVAPVRVNKNTGHIVDGHLRVQIAMRKGQPTVPVDYLDLTPEEEDLVLATFDPIAALAVSDNEKIEELMADIEVDDERLQDLLSTLDINKAIKDLKNKSKELDPNDYNDFEHKCPKCGFEYD